MPTTDDNDKKPKQVNAAPPKQMTAQEYEQQKIKDQSSTPAAAPTDAPKGADDKSTPPSDPLVKLNQQQLDDKYKGNPYLVAGRDQWSNYLNADFPFSGTNVKKGVYAAASATGVDPSLLMASSMEEGMGGLINNPDKTSTDYNVAVGGTGGKPKFDKDKYPVDGYYSFGLDTFADQAPSLIKKGLLPADFAKNYQKLTAKNEQGATVDTAAFTTEDAALQAKAAMLENTRNNLNDYAKKNNITLTPRQQDFFNLVGYNAGEGNMQKMMQSYKEKGYLKDDKFLTDVKFKPTSYGDPFTYAQRRLFGRDRMNDAGNFSDYKAPEKKDNATTNTGVTTQNREDWNKFVESGAKDLKQYIKDNPKTSLTEDSATALQKDMEDHKQFLKKQVDNGSMVYAPGVTHDNLMKNTPPEKHKFHPKYINKPNA